VALAFEFTVEVNTGSGLVEFRDANNDTLLLSIDSAGNIDTDLSFDDFAARGRSSLWACSAVAELDGAVPRIRHLQRRDPLHGRLDGGDFLSWSQLFLDEIYSEMISVELQSRSLTASSAGNLASVDFKIQLALNARPRLAHGRLCRLERLGDALQRRPDDRRPEHAHRRPHQ